MWRYNKTSDLKVLLLFKQINEYNFILIIVINYFYSLGKVAY